MASSWRDQYRDHPIPRRVDVTLTALEELGFGIRAAAAGSSTLRVDYGGQRRGYVNPQVRNRRGVLGYAFSAWGAGADHSPVGPEPELRRRFCERYGCAPADIAIHAGSGDKLYLVILEEDVAVQIACQDAGVAPPPGAKLPSARLLAGVGGLDALRETFLARMGDFGDFRDTDGFYWSDERAYKEELSELCRASLSPALFPPEPDEATARAAVRAVQRVLTQRLATIRRQQNLLRWQDDDFLKELDAAERATFTPAFGDLLFGAADGAERAGRFVATMWPIWRRIRGGNPYALSRLFPTLFLMLMDPARHFAVRTDLVDAAGRALLGDNLLPYAPLGARRYRHVLSLAAKVRETLNAWAWQPRDLMDVQSFLWVVTRPDSLYTVEAAHGG